MTLSGWCSASTQVRQVRPRCGALCHIVQLAGIIWHMLTKDQDYAAVRPALHAKKLRDLELRSGLPARRGQRGSGYEYNLTRTRLEEKRRAEQAEVAYQRQVEGWTKRGRRAAPTDAAKVQPP